MQNKKKTDIFDVIINIIMILLAILVVYWFIKLIFGGSPDFSEFNFALIVLIIGFLFKLYREMGEVKIEMKHITLGIKESFNKTKGDMNLIKTDINSIKKKLKI